MNKSETSSPWALDNSTRTAAPLAGDTRYDVCVVGAGIAGLTTAYLLANEGKSVVVLDGKPKVASGETEYTTAHLAWVIDDRFSRLASVRGDEAAKLAAASHRSAIELIEAIVRRENIACSFQRVDGYLFPGASKQDAIRDEAVALTRLGLPFTRVEKVPFPAKATGPALVFPYNGQFHPIKYLTELARLIRAKGGVIHTETQVANIDSGDPCKVHTQLGNTLTAGSVVVATGSPFDTGVTMHMKVAAYITYAIALEIPTGYVQQALYWDTEDPYHYVRTAPNGGGKQYLIVGGEDHKTGQADDQAARWERLEAWTRERFPQAGKLVHHWSGEVFETPDGLGLIGRAPGLRENVYVITGDSGMGMTHGTLGARLVADLITGRTNPYAGLYSPSRWMPGALATLLGEALNMAGQYTDWVTGGEVKSAEDIPPGHGAVVRSGLTKLAVYKDDEGRVHELSAVCPHMGAIVQWNPGEKMWDCPCHGSRFKCTGEVMHGPSTEGLAPASDAAAEGEPVAANLGTT
jgi:glycine/D-amino acid oxidase-like deaminating enzyme/nitrite reductase/ring-hydroxylating ferredoxin subunit